MSNQLDLDQRMGTKCTSGKLESVHSEHQFSWNFPKAKQQEHLMIIMAYCAMIQCNIGEGVHSNFFDQPWRTRVIWAKNFTGPEGFDHNTNWPIDLGRFNLALSISALAGNDDGNFLCLKPATTGDIILSIVCKCPVAELEGLRVFLFCLNSGWAPADLIFHLGWETSQFCSGLVFQPIWVCSGLVFQPIWVFVVAWCSNPFEFL